jgi:hypothetical protein
MTTTATFVFPVFLTICATRGACWRKPIEMPKYVRRPATGASLPPIEK